MIIPVRCFTCGKVIGNKYEKYLELLQSDFSEGDALDALAHVEARAVRVHVAHADHHVRAERRRALAPRRGQERHEQRRSHDADRPAKK